MTYLSKMQRVWSSACRRHAEERSPAAVVREREREREGGRERERERERESASHTHIYM